MLCRLHLCWTKSVCGTGCKSEGNRREKLSNTYFSPASFIHLSKYEHIYNVWIIFLSMSQDWLIHETLSIVKFG